MSIVLQITLLIINLKFNQKVHISWVFIRYVLFLSKNINSYPQICLNIADKYIICQKD